MATCRNRRRAGDDLAGSAVAVDGASAAQFGPERFVTGVLAELDLASGCLRWSVFGHPPVLAEEMLEPADQLLFFTDGVVEGRAADGELFGVDRLVEMVFADVGVGHTASGDHAASPPRHPRPSGG